MTETKIGTLVESVARIADAFDRLVTLLEELANAIDLPTLPTEDPTEDHA